MLLTDHFSIVNLSSAVKKSSHSSYISELDKDYISRFRNPKRQHTTLVLRNLTRELLWKQTGVPKHQWEFSILENKSRIAVSDTGETFHVSFSHCPNFGAVTISQTPVGIDVEEVKQSRPWEKMIDFLDLPETTPKIKNQVEFLHHWTTHEARIKFRSASKKAIAFHQYRLSKNVVLCLASSLDEDLLPILVPSETSLCRDQDVKAVIKKL